ncbi:hypothetical protein P7H12_17835 [Paenibacillus larvae]|nr:hypothetical protein [Paenibacillus larvae]MDT2265066.1 hypothetical protein [Paenibacillus larvae]
MQEEWLDYIAPQVYWSFDFSLYPIQQSDRLVDRANTRENVHLYTGGHTAYKIANDTASWNNPDEIPNQIKYNTERFNQVKEACSSAAKITKSNRLGIGTVSFRDSYRYPALVPAVPWMTGSHPLPLL